MPHSEKEKRTTVSLLEMKSRAEKICAVTAYDHPTSELASTAGMDIILVGDSLGMVLQGYKNTLKVSVAEVLYHTTMVTRAEPLSLVVADMPFQSYQVSPEKAVENAGLFIKEGGAEAVKIEGGRRRFKTIKAIIEAEIPVMAHLGLTPQSVHQLGGFKVQGKAGEQAREIFDQALELEQLGVFALVLESIPAELGKKISRALKIPTIGIGAGPDCDGQILVFHDLVGLTHLYLPKFVRRFSQGHQIFLEALKNYGDEVRRGSFPGPQESYHHKDEQEWASFFNENS